MFDLVLNVNVFFQLLQVGNNNRYEEIHHGDRPEQDEQDEEENCKSPTYLVIHICFFIFECVVQIVKIELTCHVGS